MTPDSVLSAVRSFAGPDPDAQLRLLAHLVSELLRDTSAGVQRRAWAMNTGERLVESGGARSGDVEAL